MFQITLLQKLGLYDRGRHRRSKGRTVVESQMFAACSNIDRNPGPSPYLDNQLHQINPFFAIFETGIDATIHLMSMSGSLSSIVALKPKNPV